MSCPTCILALAGTDGFSVDSPNKTNAAGAAVGAVVGYLISGKYRWAGLALGAAAGYFLAPAVTKSVSRPQAAAEQKAALAPPAGRPPVPPPKLSSSQTIRLMPATALQPPPEVTTATETDEFLQEWMSTSEGPMEFR